MLKKSLATAMLISASSTVFAAAPGGPGCGWGNLMFEGDSGKVAHIGASIFNGSSGNNWIGILVGTNGCDSSEKITYGGKSFLAMNGLLDELAEDIAIGKGEALTALSVSLGIKKEERPAFNVLMNENFAEIFPNEEMNASEVGEQINAVLKQDSQFAKYAS